MQTLRRSTQITRLVLAWFALSLGVVIASPVVNPKVMELVCSSAGAVKLVALGEGDANANASAHTMDCPLCVIMDAPPPAVYCHISLSLPPALVASWVATSRTAQASAPPLPSRGPPAHTL
ncbi:MAG: hypothetical protein RLZ36_637 [Pseudomonadota bacterium]|jgi:hypothetical protein